MLPAAVRRTASMLFKGYAAVLFAERPLVGALILLATFWFPNAGFSGLLAVLAGALTAGLLKFRNLDSGLHLYNSLLVGLSLGAYYQLDLYLAALVVMGAIIAVLVSVALADLAWRLGRLPILSLPFVLVALTVTLAAHSYGTLSRYLLPLAPHQQFVSPMVDRFLTAMGSAFFIPHPMAGLMMFLGVLVTSRYMAMLAVSGFLCGFSVYSFLSGSPNPELVAWNGFNFILVAMALGGLFTVPGLQSFLLAMLGAAIAALVTSASETFMLVYGLPVMALPFLITTLTVLLALGNRPATKALQLTLEAPALPEKSAERFRLAMARHGEFGSVPVMLPFYGSWDVYQGFNGKHTHQPPWQHALDFYITDNGQSFHTDGESLNDYFCFGLPVLSPVEGLVVGAVDNLPDNPPGSVDMENNWGNHLLIRTPGGLHALLAHLKQDSIGVQKGAYVHAGQQVAECGSSGRSPQPHLHLHLQWGEPLGSATCPFHLSTVLHRPAGTERSEFRLFCNPAEGDRVMHAKTETALGESLQMNVGQELCYRVECNGRSFECRLHVELNMAGELRLVSDSGASAAMIMQEKLLAFYDRSGPRDVFLDAWLLALGLTPKVEGELNWEDRPSMKLMPMRWQQRLAAGVLLPMGGGITSRFTRKWDGRAWVQSGAHGMRLPVLGNIEASTLASIEPRLGCRSLRLQSDAVSLQASLLAVGQKADAGIPEWRLETPE